MKKRAAIVICVLLSLLAVMQLLLALGLPIGRFAWGGQYETLPVGMRVASLVSIALYAFFASIALQKAGITNFYKNQKFVNVSIWVIVGYSTLGILMNAASRSDSERNVMTPTVIILAICNFILAKKSKKAQD